MNVDNFFQSRYSGLYKTRSSISNRRKTERRDLPENRRDRRHAMTNSNRNLDEPDGATENIRPIVNLTDDRKTRLKKWKDLKKDKIIQNKKDLKKPFVVGIVRHRINSPIHGLLRTNTKPKSNPVPTTRKRTRAELKKENVQPPLEYKFPFKMNIAKVNSVFKFKAISSTKKLTKPESPMFMRREAAKKLQLKQYSFPQTKKTEEKKSSSDEELAAPLSPPQRVTRSQRTKLQSIRSPTLKKNTAEKANLVIKSVPCAHKVVLKTVKNHMPTNEMIENAQSTSTNVLIENAQETPENDLMESAQQTATNLFAAVSRKTITDDFMENVQDTVTNAIAGTSQGGSTSGITDDSQGPSTSELVENKQVTSPNNSVVSPFVTITRGWSSEKRNNLAKYCQMRRKISLRDTPVLDEPADGPTFQKTRLNNESSRLLLLAEDWEKFARLENLKCDVHDEIDAVVGQTRLLTSKKFEQFRTLIEQHEADDENMKVTVDDLNGFWEMMYFQVVDLDKKYDRLEVLKSNNWEEPKLPVRQKSVRLATKKVVLAKSSIREFIKGKKKSTQTSLIKQVLTPEAKIRRRSSSSSVGSNSPGALNALRKSITAKNFGRVPDIVVSQLTINTPKSCLKTKSNESLNISSVKKTVLFNQNIEYDEEQRNQSQSPIKHEWLTSEMESSFTPRRSARLSAKYSKQETS